MNKIIIGILVILIIAGIYFVPKFFKKENNSMQENNSIIQEVQVEIIKEGTGESAKIGDTVSVHYSGTLENGQKFDSSLDRGQPFSFTLGQNMVIKGWEIGVLGMKIGEKRKLIIPSSLAYGSQGAGDIISPNATLIFEIELLEISK